MARQKTDAAWNQADINQYLHLPEEHLILIRSNESHFSVGFFSSLRAEDAFNVLGHLTLSPSTHTLGIACSSSYPFFLHLDKYFL